MNATSQSTGRRYGEMSSKSNQSTQMSPSSPLALRQSTQSPARPSTDQPTCPLTLLPALLPTNLSTPTNSSTRLSAHLTSPSTHTPPEHGPGGPCPNIHQALPPVCPLHWPNGPHPPVCPPHHCPTGPLPLVCPPRWPTGPPAHTHLEGHAADQCRPVPKRAPDACKAAAHHAAPEVVAGQQGVHDVEAAHDEAPAAAAVCLAAGHLCCETRQGVCQAAVALQQRVLGRKRSIHCSTSNDATNNRSR
jgi:hypothetical protein